MNNRRLILRPPLWRLICACALAAGIFAGLVLRPAEAAPSAGCAAITGQTQTFVNQTTFFDVAFNLSFQAGEVIFIATTLNGGTAGTFEIRNVVTVAGPAAMPATLSYTLPSNGTINLEFRFTPNPGGTSFSYVITCIPVPEPVITAAGLGVPNLGLIRISTAQSQPVYQRPGGRQPIRDGAGREIRLPNDADGNGYDTYTVAEVRIVSGQVWLGIFLGSASYGYVPLSRVTPITRLPMPQG